MNYCDFAMYIDSAITSVFGKEWLQNQQNVMFLNENVNQYLQIITKQSRNQKKKPILFGTCGPICIIWVLIMETSIHQSFNSIKRVFKMKQMRNNDELRQLTMHAFWYPMILNFNNKIKLIINDAFKPMTLEINKELQNPQRQ